MPRDTSLVVILVALTANVALAVLKFGAYLLTASPSMLAETYHSISDTGNQVLLLVGLYYGKKRATRHHPFGYGKATFFYALLVSVLLFGVAGWESLKHGISSLGQLSPVTDGTVTVLDVTFPAVYVAYVILLATIAFDGISYWKARQAIDVEIDERGWEDLPQAFAGTSDMPVLAVMTENAVATLGATVALVGIFLSQVTGNPVFDALGAVTIGVLLMAFAIALGWENKQLLIGEALTPEHQRPLEQIVRNWDGVVGITDFRTVYFGADSVLVTADVVFEPDLDTAAIDERITEMELELRETEPVIQKVYIEPEISPSTLLD